MDDPDIISMTTAEAIDLTAQDLIPLLDKDNVTNLVLISMLSLPDNLPTNFSDTYTPIAAAGGQAQVAHLARLLASQMTATGVGVGFDRMEALKKVCLFKSERRSVRKTHKTDRYTRQTDRHTRQTDRHTRQTDRQTHKTDRQTDTQNRQTDTQNRQTDRHTDVRHCKIGLTQSHLLQAQDPRIKKESTKSIPVIGSNSNWTGDADDDLENSGVSV
jgi:hypothetical protein